MLESVKPDCHSTRSLRIFAISTVVTVAIVLTGEVLAHGAERGLVLLLPTGFFMVGGALAVAASYVLLAGIPIRWFKDHHVSLSIPFPTINRLSTSLLGLIFLCLLIGTGFAGSRDPLSNPLPLTVWTLWWVGFMILQAIVGDLWHWFNPWYAIAVKLKTGAGIVQRRISDKAGYIVAIVQFGLFAWVELVYLSPEDPEHLAWMVAAYFVFNLAGCLVFGAGSWLATAEPFSVFSRFLGLLSPFLAERISPRKISLSLHWPGFRLVSQNAPVLVGTLFLLLALSSVSFDGLSRTFTWLSIWQINPLEFPGRSAVTVQNSLGLIGFFAGLASIYCLAVWMGCRLAGKPELLYPSIARLVYSILPISLVFHLAHYLTLLMVNGQYAALAWNDPFETGADLFGISSYHVTTSFLAHLESVRVLWTAQTSAIVIGHIAGIVVAHRIALSLYGELRAAVLSQLPLAVFMVGYTVFGLWLLSTPSIG